MGAKTLAVAVEINFRDCSGKTKAQRRNIGMNKRSCESRAAIVRLLLSLHNSEKRNIQLSNIFSDGICW